MKVLLVATNREASPYPVAPLGALYVAAAARAAGHRVDLLDLGTAPAPQSTLRKVLQTGDYQAVAFGIRNLDNCWAFAPRLFFDEVQALAQLVRSHFKGPLILGGSGFSVSPRGWMKRMEADCGVVGEGERAFSEILDRLEAGRSLDGIEGVITASSISNSNHIGPTRSIEKLAELPPPAHELCGYARYVRRGGFVGVQTKRGCPFGCVYCIYPLLEGRRYRLRPPEAVAEEIDRAALQAGVRHFFFVDSVFNDPRSHARAICEAMSRRRLKVSWEAFCNPVGFDLDLAQAMARAGCVGVEFGLDVATPRMLEALHKPFGQEEIRVALQAARDARIPFVLYMLFGGPGETWKDVQESQAFLASCAPANAVFATFGIRVYESTPLVEIAAREGQIAAGQDLFPPAYYLSPAMSESTEKNMDLIARQCPEWTSPADWRKPVVQWAQKLSVWLRIRPQWKYIRGYGQYMRR